MMNERITEAVIPTTAERLLDALELRPGERLERAYVFDVIERAGVAFLLTLVTKRLADGRLEMAALGSRGSGTGEIALEFARRASFPEDVLPSILAELIDRSGAQGAVYREIELNIEPGAKPSDQAATLLEHIVTSGGSG
jgi:hypothetical protein